MKRSSEYSKRRPRASTRKRSGKKAGRWSSFFPQESPKAKELRMQFTHLKSQLDFANSEAEIAAIVNEGEKFRRKGVKQDTPNTANEQYRLLVDKAKKRATYLGLKPYAERLTEVLIAYAPALASRKMRIGGTETTAPASTAITLAQKGQIVEMKETGPGVFEPT